MKMKFRRIVGAICALALCVSMIPASALAETDVYDSDSAIVEQVEEDSSVPAADSSEDSLLSPESQPGEEPAEEPAGQPEEEPAEEPAAQPEEEPAEEPASQPEEEPEEEPAAQPEEEPAEEPEEEPVEEPADQVDTYSVSSDVAELSDSARASSNVTVVLNQTVTYYGKGSTYLIHDWEVKAGTGVVSIRSDGNKVVITGKQTGTATLKHTYGILGYTETVTVNVVKNITSDRTMFLFVAKPGNTTLSNVGSDYYYLANGGKVADSANTSTFVKNTTNEAAVTQYVQTWPTELDFLSNTSSESVGRNSTWTINSETGEVSSFSLWLGNELYTSANYGIRWAKFSYADTASYGNHYHVDAILYEKQTVNNVIVNELNAKKLLKDFSLNEQGVANTSETFNFSIVDLDDNNEIKGDVNIPLTVTVDQTSQAVALNAGAHGDDVLAPGRYMLYETQESNDPVWQTANSVIFEIYTNGNINVVSGGTKGNIVITNTPKTYTLSYEMNGGTGNIPDVTNLKYNAKTKVSDVVPENTGNVFLGWSTTPNGKVKYASGDEIQIEGNVTLYAVWGPVSVTKSVVLAGTSVDDSVIADKGDYATVVAKSQGDQTVQYVTYTTDGTADILYKVNVNAYTDAVVEITDTPTGGTVSYIGAVGATTSDGGQSFTMTSASATLYYAVAVTGVTDSKVVGNSVDWTIASQSSTAAADDVTVIKTDKTAKIEKSITQIQRGQQTIDKVTDETILRVGDIVTWQIKITNTSKVDLEGVELSDEINASGTLPVSAELKVNNGQGQTLTNTWTNGTNGYHNVTWNIGDLKYNVESDTGDFATVTYTYTVAADDKSLPDTKDLVNTASAEGIQASTGSDLTTENFVEVPSIQVEKEGTAQVSDNGKMQIAYTVKVKNDGNAPLTSIVLKDSKFPASVTVKNDGVEVASGKVQLSGDTLTVNDPLAIGKELTVEYVYDVTEQADSTGNLTVSNTVNVTAATSEGNSASGNASASTEVYSGTVTLALAPIVIYTGGNGTSQAIIGEDGQPVESDDSGLPTFGVTMTLPNNDNVSVEDQEVAAELYDITSSTGERAGYRWSAVAYNANATVLMQLTPEDETTAARILLTDDKDNVITSDDFSVGEELSQTYTTELYVAELDTTTIIAEVDNKFYQIEYQPSSLTVRGTTPDAQTNKVVNSADDLSSDIKTPQAVMPEGAAFYYVSGNGDNSGKLQVGDTSSVSLLVDEIVDQAVETDQQYVQMMKDKVEADDSLLGAVPADTARVWRFYYMDLVLANNGNAVLTSDSDVTVYWPYPDGISYQDAVSGKYSFTMLHYTGLNRNYASDSFATELKDCRVAEYKVTPTAQGLCFTVPASDGFSPYALVYEYSTKSGEQTTTVTGTPTPDEHPDIADAKANGTWGQPTPTPAGSVIPQTSDDMPLGMLLGIAGIAAAAVVVLMVMRRRRKQ